MYEDIREYSLTYDPLLSGVSLKWVLYFASESPESGSGQNGIIKFKTTIVQKGHWLHTRTSDLNRYVTEVTSINEHHGFFTMPISTEQFQSLLHCKCQANTNTNTLISGPTRATYNFITKTKCWRAWHHVNWTSSACIYLCHYQIITTWILWGHYVRQLIL